MSRVIAHVIQDQGETAHPGSPSEVHAQVKSTDSAPSGPSASTGQSQTWIEEINKAYGFNVGWVIKTGDLLAQAKRQLGHGRWSLLFGEGKLKFGLRTAEMLMEVARHPSFRNSKNFSSLPSAWSVLHALSKLRAEIVDQAMANGFIHSEMSLADARRFAKTANTEAFDGTRAPIQFDPVLQRKRLMKYLRFEAARWPAEYVHQLAELLQAVALQLLADDNSESEAPREGRR